VTKKFLYIDVDTPEGRISKDIDAIFDASGNLEDVKASNYPTGYFEPIFTRKYLDHHAEAALTEVLARFPAIKGTPDLISYVFQLFHANVGEIVEYLRRTGQTGKFEGFSCHLVDAPVCLLVSGFPWRTGDVTANLANYSSGGGGYPYKEVLDALLRQKPAAHLTHWAHFVICMKDGNLHASAGSYGSRTTRWQAFSWPAEILSEREKRDLRPSHPSYHR